MDELKARHMGLGMLTPDAQAAMTGATPRMTLRDARQRLETAATPAEQKALKQWVARYELREEAKRQHRLRASVADATERATQTALRLREMRAELAEKAADAERGRISSEQLRQAVLDADRAAREARASAEGEDSNFNSREQLKAADLADLQEEQMRKFPALADRTLPTLLSEIPSTAPVHQPGHPLPEMAVGYSVRAANVNPADSIQAHADELFGAVQTALRTLETTEASEKALAVPAPAADRIPAMRTRGLA